MADWTELSYLRRGSSAQREAYSLLRRLQMMERLAGYRPLLVGTVPLDIQVAGSDLDIICEVYDQERFAEEVRREYGRCDGFRVVIREADGVPCVVVNFGEGGWPIELFGQPRRTEQQNGYRHMLVEWEILKILGSDFRQDIITLKTRGIKTEPAFAQILKLEGDPYEALLELAVLSHAELETLCRKAHFRLR